MKPIAAGLAPVLAELQAKLAAGKLPIAKSTACPRCNGFGQVVVMTELGSVASRCSCVAPRELTEEDVRERLLAAGMGKHDVASALSPWEPQIADPITRSQVKTPWPKAVDAWWLDRAGPLTLYGPPGTGKTKAAATIAARAIRERLKGGVCWRYSEKMPEALFRKEEDTTPGQRTGAEEKAALQSCGLLIIDDVHRVVRNRVVWDAVGAVIDGRFNHDMPTILTANAEAGRAFELPDAMMTSRLAGGVLVPMATSKDLRELRAISRKAK